MFWSLCFARALEMQWELCCASSCPTEPLCAAFPEDTEQVLCSRAALEQGAVNATPFTKKAPFHMGKGWAGRAEPWNWNPAQGILILLRRNLCKHHSWELPGEEPLQGEKLQEHLWPLFPRAGAAHGDVPSQGHTQNLLFLISSSPKGLRVGTVTAHFLMPTVQMHLINGAPKQGTETASW